MNIIWIFRSEKRRRIALRSFWLLLFASYTATWPPSSKNVSICSCVRSQTRSFMCSVWGSLGPVPK